MDVTWPVYDEKNWFWNNRNHRKHFEYTSHYVFDFRNLNPNKSENSSNQNFYLNLWILDLNRILMKLKVDRKYSDQKGSNNVTAYAILSHLCSIEFLSEIVDHVTLTPRMCIFGPVRKVKMNQRWTFEQLKSRDHKFRRKIQWTKIAMSRIKKNPFYPNAS